MTRRYTRGAWRSALGMVLAIGTTMALAQSYPTKPIRFIVAASPTSPVDIISRWILDGMTADLGQGFVVENKVGGVYQIALNEVLRAPADGYTMLVISLPVAVAPSIVDNYPIDLRKDFVTLARTVSSYNILVVPNDSPAKSLAELIALLKADPGKRSYVSGGPGTPAHVIGELFKQVVGLDVLHVPYLQLAQGVGDLIGGRIDYGFLTSAPMIPQIKGGKLRALAVTAPHRLPVIAEVPTVGEAGFPALQVSDWALFLVKAGTPAAVIERLSAATRKVITAPSAPEALAKFGAEPNYLGPEEARRFFDVEIDRWAKVARTGNIKLQP